MKIVIFGGSFNPVHIGHLFIAEEIRTGLKYDKVLFIPSNIPAHKTDNTGLPAEKRLYMLETALKNEDNSIVDDCDIKRGGITYSIDTLKYIYKNYKFMGRPGFIIGDDLLDGIRLWKDAEKLMEMIDLIVVRRNSEHLPEQLFSGFTVNNEVLPVSSTDIRKRIKEGRTIKHLVPESVKNIIIENGYYK